MKKISFKKAKITSTNLRKKSSFHEPILAIFVIFLALGITLSIFFKIFFYLSEKVNFTGIIPTFQIKTDSYNNTNFLLLGTGGEGHSGENLTDTIILASLDHDNNYATLLSFPRDLYVDSNFGKTKINNIYEFAIEKYGEENQARAIKEVVSIIEKITAIPIHYYVKVDFKGFIEAVDTLGGIEIYLKEPFVDYLFPTERGFEYETFYLPKGVQTLDGKTTLKYVRSRHSTSDFDRSKRQQQILTLIKDKALKIGLLTNPTKLKMLYEAFSKNILTNLKWDEILVLSKRVTSFSTNNILSQTIHNDPTEVGGFLYTPDRQYFANAYVLIPINATYYKLDQYQEIQNFTHIFNYATPFFSKNISFEIQNGTKESGLASLTERYLKRYGFKISNFKNAPNRNIEYTTIEISNNRQILPEIINLIQKFIPGKIVYPISDSKLEQQPTSDIIITLGKDYKNFFKQNKKLFY